MANKKRMNYASCLKRLKGAARDRNISDYLWETLCLYVVHFEENPDILNDLKLGDMLKVAQLCRDFAEIQEAKVEQDRHNDFAKRLEELHKKKVSQTSESDSRIAMTDRTDGQTEGQARHRDRQTTRHADIKTNKISLYFTPVDPEYLWGFLFAPIIVNSQQKVVRHLKKK